MYTEYFGLKEPAFSITPDPQFLYLSREHREALAHLFYGAGEGGGFVLLTGEVGTGKTTICRSFLEHLPEPVDIALILNPALTVPELLRTVCEEFGVGALNETGSTKLFLDRLNRYLLDAHAKGRRPVLMIDEAQSLQPEVLEQVRLLTNLETDKHKLLKIFLIGQPELKQMLRQKKLRQLAQRITARYHLLPLNSEETTEYISHRLAVAGAERSLFSPGAIRHIYRHSGGVPRLINMLCDRALLGAYASRSHQVNSRIVVRSVRELRGSRSLSEKHTDQKRSRATALLLLLTITGGWFAWSLYERTAEEPVTFAAVEDIPQELELPVPQKLRDGTQTVMPPQAEVKTAEHVATPAIEHMMRDQRSGMKLLLAHWGLSFTQENLTPPCQFARMHKLLCREGTGNWNKLRSYDRPALIKLIDSEEKHGYSLVVGLSEHHASLIHDGSRVDLPLDVLDAYWSGEFVLLWRPPENGTVLITPQASGEEIQWLRQILSRVPGFSAVGNGPGVYDESLHKAVQHFQSSNGLKPDGLVGPDTMIMLNTLTAATGVPMLEEIKTVVATRREQGMRANLLE